MRCIPTPSRPALPGYRRAFTLVELMIAMTLMVVLITIMATILNTARAMRDVAVNRVRVMDNARAALAQIQYDLGHLIPLGSDVLTDDDYPLGLELRSCPDAGSHQLNPPSYVPVADWATNNELDVYVDSPSTPVHGDTDIDNAFFMSFFSTVGYYDPYTATRRVRLARVVYYLKQRPEDTSLPGNTGKRYGAYLVRRVEPFHWEENAGVPGTFDCVWDDPVEDNICDFLRGVRVYYFDRDRDYANNKDVRFVEAHPGANPSPPAPDLWDATDHVVRFRIDPDWANNEIPFEQQEFLPPAILIKLLICNDRGLTLREVSQVMNVNISPQDLPSKPGLQ